MAIIRFTVSRDDQIYEAWPDLVLTRQGKLICVFSECRHHGDRSYTRLVLAESSDRGRTWTGKRPLTDATHGFPYWNCARISHLGHDRLAIVADRISAPNEESGQNFLWFADAEGTRWQGPYKTPAIGIVPDKITVSDQGRWLLSVHEKNPQHGFLAQRLWYSDDQGQKWTGPVIVADQPGLNLCEATILKLPDRRLVAIMRENSGEGRDAFKAISDDDGMSWQGPYPMPLPGCHRPVAGLLQSSRVLITYRFMQGGKGWLGNWTQNFFAALTDVESVLARERNRQWTRILPIDYDRSPVADLGYSGWVQFDDGEIYLVNYIVDDAPKAQIRGYSLSEADFLLDTPG